MKRKQQIFLGTILLLAIFLEILWDFHPMDNLRKDINDFPKTGIGYVGRDIPLTSSEAKLYDSGNVIKRLYQVGREQFVLMILDGSKNRHLVHDPVYCFRGAGWDVMSTNEYQIKKGTARILRLLKNNKEKEILFWFSDGNNSHGSILKYWGQSTLRRLTLGASGKEPILLILQPVGETVLDWRRILDQFSILLTV